MKSILRGATLGGRHKRGMGNVHSQSRSSTRVAEIDSHIRMGVDLREKIALHLRDPDKYKVACVGKSTHGKRC